MSRFSLSFLLLSFLVTSSLSSAPIVVEEKKSADLPTTSLSKTKGKITSIKELSSQPGIFLTQMSTTGDSSLFIRGAKSEHTLVLLDDIPLNDPTNPGQKFDFSQLSSLFYDSIELIKGPQVVLYGRGAMGGVVRLKTKAPKSKEGHFSVGGGSYEQWQTKGSYEDYLATDSLSGRIAFQVGGGSGVKGKAIHPYHKRSGEAYFLYEKENNRVHLSMQKSFQKAYYGTGKSNDGTGGHFKSHQDYLRTSFERSWSESLETQFNVSYRQIDRKESYGPFSGTILLSQLKGQLDLNSHNTLWFGGEHQEQRATFDHKKNKSTDNASYILHKITAGSFSSRQGIRYQKHSLFSADFNYQITPSLSFEDLGVTLELGYGHAVNYPSLYQIYSTYGNKNLTTERGDQYQISLEKTFQKASIEGTLFYNKFDNLLNYNMTTNKYENLDKIKTYGYELSSSQEILPKTLTLSEDFTYLKTLDIKKRTPLLRQPTYTAHLTETWKISDNFQWTNQGEYVGTRQDIGYNGKVTKNKSYLLFNTSVEYKIKPVSLSFSINNVFDNKYEQNLKYSSPGRNIYATLHSTF